MAKVCKFQIEKQQVSYDCAETWQDTGNTRKIEDQEPVERYSPDCGWSDSFLYRWVEDESGYTCNGYHKYSTKSQQVSYDQGESWEDVPGSAQIDKLIEKFSTDCCQIRTVTADTCDELFRYVNASIEEASLDGETWVQTGNYTINSVISAYSPECLAGADVKYLGIPASGSSGDSVFSYRYYENSVNPWEDEGKSYIHSNYVIIGCDRDYDYYDNGGIEEIYVSDCYTGGTFSGNSQTTLKRINISSGATGGFGGFRDFTALTEINGLGNSNITKIDECAFDGCTSLRSVEIPESCYFVDTEAFEGCTSLSSVTIYSHSLNVNSITGGSQFRGCTSLETVVFPNDYQGVINWYMFSGCTSLSSVTFGNVTVIGLGAFAGCTSLVSIDLGNSVRGIGSGAFNGCTSLTDVYVGQKDNILSSVSNTSFPSGCTIHVPCEAYGYWYQVYEIDHPDLGVSIEMSGTSACVETQWVESGTTCVGYDLYSRYVEQMRYGSGDVWRNTGNESAATLIEVDSLDCGYVPADYRVKVEYGDGTQMASECETTGSQVTRSELTAFPDSAFTKCWLGECVTSLGNNLFYHYYSVQEVHLPSSVSSIPSRNFQRASGLTTINLDNITSIKQSAFQECYSLSAITIPATMEYIEANAFYKCRGLQSITCLGTTPPQLRMYGQAKGWFDMSTCPIYVPSSAVETYKAAQYWSEYSDRIQAIQS